VSDVVVMTKEVVVTLAMNPEFQDFTWLIPVRRNISTGSPRSGCRSCPGKSTPSLSDVQHQAALASLTGSKEAEVPGTKRILGAAVLRLPFPSGPIDI
jgi:hypothetical protein